MQVFVGLSGGVDSSVTALLLKQQGYQVHAVFMQNWDEMGEDPFCPADKDLQDARSVCERLDIPLSTIRFAEEYWNKVFQHFLDEYAAGRTPNPDILCNKEIKFKAFLDYALSQGADYIATGHYARISQSDGSYQLLKAKDLTKDQSYFLYTLQAQQLAKTLFPLGEINKSEVREIAHRAGFVNHAKKDSTGICFIGERKFKTFLGEYLLARPGEVKDLAGNTIGKHEGLMFYTIGQRQGLGIGGRKDAQSAPWYVLDKDLVHNVLIIGQSHDHPNLLRKTLTCHQLHWVSGASPTLPFSCTAKTRYRQSDAPCCIVKAMGDTYWVEFQEAQWAVTPGQSVVFYRGDVCLGGGIIL